MVNLCQNKQNQELSLRYKVNVERIRYVDVKVNTANASTLFKISNCFRVFNSCTYIGHLHTVLPLVVAREGKTSEK